MKSSATSIEKEAKIVEAAELRNGGGVTFQFHPELMNNAEGKKIMKNMVNYAAGVKKTRM
jgi:anthranilate/para-aminobenzoate synthase component II